jgi:outer membrane murein-binding lipoprotein Lpp
LHLCLPQGGRCRKLIVNTVLGSQRAQNTVGTSAVWGHLVKISTNSRRSNRLLAGAALAPLLIAGFCATASAQTADTAQLQSEINALKAQMKALETKMHRQAQVQPVAYPPPPPGAAPVPYEPPFFADKKFHMGGITITPGGFLAAEGVWRARDTGGDFSPAFGSLTEYNSPLAHLNELRMTARQSRVSALVEGAINPATTATAYGELDFLGAGVTPNSNESNSYQPRVRVLYGTVDWNDIGLHLLAGQSWSLVTLQGKGITPRNEVIPATIDAQYVAGFNWTRQPGIRLTKEFGNNFTAAIAAEMPQTTNCPSAAPAGTVGVQPTPTSLGGNQVVCNQVGSTSGSSVLNSSTTYSFNHVPDIIGKVAWEPTIGDRTIHIEGFGMYTDLYDYVENGVAPGGLALNNTRYDTTGWGAGGGIIIPVMPKFIDLQGTAMVGRGIGRYGSGQLTEATLNPNGSLDPLPEVMFMGGATIHATPWLDFYVYGGEEKLLSSDSGTGFAGLSPATANNSGCFIVNGTCAGKVQTAMEITGGFWDKIYQGSFGSVRVGIQYAYIQDTLFAGTGSSGGLPAFQGQPKFNNQEVFASFRYYPFDNPAPAPALVTSKY